VDLIYGVQTETVAEAEDDARRAVALSPEHVSAYALTLDKASLAEEVPLAKQLARGEVTLPPDEQVIEMQRAFEGTLSAAGLLRYEVSNYAKAGYHSRHNALYWTGGEYLALGAGATGTVGRLRYSNHRSAEKWFEALGARTLPHAGEEPLDDEALCAERVAMGLRLASGVALDDVLHDFGRTLGAKQAVVARLVREGFAELADGRLRLTSRGFDVHSAIAAALL
jgi:oxygen-independent coproporphyrinogen-3 oxidase